MPDAPPPDAPPPDAMIDAGDHLAPQTTITATPSGISGQDVMFQFDADEAGSTFVCKVDSGQSEPCESPKAYVGLSGGSHTFAVVATDRAGNTDLTPATFTWTVDTKVLDTSITQAPPSVSGRDVTFRFSATRQGTFECSLEPVEATFSACASPKTYSALTEGSNPLTFRVRAVDTAQNVDDTPATLTWTVDATPPSVEIASPAGTTSARPQLVFSTEPGASYICHFDIGSTFACASGASINFDLSEGGHIISVVGTDAVGNESAEASKSFVVDATPPTFNSFSGPVDASATGPNVSFTYAISDGSLSCTIDEVAPPAGCASPLSVAGLAVGTHSFVVTARDAVGNNASLSRTWSVEPPVSNGQAADLFLGQPNGVTGAMNQGGLGPASLWAPGQLTTAGTELLVVDTGNNRVLRWSNMPGAMMQAASGVLGQSGFTTNTAGSAQNRLSSPLGACSDGNRLYVTDNKNHRVLVWTSVDAANGSTADFVLGGTQGAGADQFNVPAQCWADANHLLVSDAANHRVLIWSPPPTPSQREATTLLGWPAFGMTSGSLPEPSASSLAVPAGILYEGGRLYVADQQHHRVLAWNGMPTGPRAADLVLGQPSFAAGASNMGGAVGAVGMSLPRAVVIARGSLFVAVSGRIMVFTPVPTQSGAPGIAANAVLGVGDLMTPPPGGVTPTTFANVYGVAALNDKLFVSESDGNRIMRFQLRY